MGRLAIKYKLSFLGFSFLLSIHLTTKQEGMVLE